MYLEIRFHRAVILYIETKNPYLYIQHSSDRASSGARAACTRVQYQTSSIQHYSYLAMLTVYG